jgi:hypothetical protein
MYNILFLFEIYWGGIYQYDGMCFYSDSVKNGIIFAKYPRKQEKFTPVDQKGMFQKFIEKQDACLPVWQHMLKISRNEVTA